jgi:hypothetical protein
MSTQHGLRPVSRLVAWFYVACVALLALTGTMQMPIASRYRIVAVPGLGWLGDFWLTHKCITWGGAAALLDRIRRYPLALEWRRTHALTALGWTRAAVLGLLIATGAVRVLKNLHVVNFSPQPVMLVDWTHLGLAFLLGCLPFGASSRAERTGRRRGAGPARVAARGPGVLKFGVACRMKQEGHARSVARGLLSRWE